MESRCRRRWRPAAAAAATCPPPLALGLALLVVHLQVVALVAAQQQSLGAGFLSLACGYVGSDPFTDYNGITWQSDGNAVSGGSPFNGNGKLNGKAAPQLQALRFFPDGLKNCYNLQLRNPGGVYLVRAGFLYGNYDEAMQPPDFGVSLGATIWVDSVKLDSGSDGSFYEAILAATSPSIAVCLLKGSVGNPFINSLELRPLPANSYSITTASQVYLYPVKRVNFGGPSLRYPKDTADRIWTNWTLDFPSLVRQFSVLSVPSNTQIIYTGSAADLPPQAVLQTAIRPLISNLSISFSLPNVPSVTTPTTFSALYLSVFSAELNSTADAAVLGLQCDSFATGPTRLDAKFNVYRIGFTNQVFANSTINCNLAKQGNSTVDPIINALELHAIQPIALGTYGPDVTAMNIIRNVFKRQDWVGDPCLPVSWDGVRCSSVSQPRVIGLVLPGSDESKLGVTIPPAIGSLTSLSQLDLDNNGLSGPIPNELSALRSLSIVNLANNQLSGPFPLWLNTTYLPNLTQVFVDNNLFTGTFSDTLTSLGTNFTYLGGNQLCSVADAQCIGQNSPASPTTPYNPPFGPGSGGSSDKDRLAKIIGGVGGGLIFLLLLLAVLAWYISEKRWSRRDKERRSVFRERLNLANLGKYTGGLAKRDWKKAPLLRRGGSAGPLKTGSSDGAVPARRFRYDELKQATNKFKTKLIEDELGVLYLGTLPKDNRKIGVKVLSECSQFTEDQFHSKIDVISKLRHPNVVPIIGYCLENSKQMIVYEHMEGGELYKLLHEPTNTRVLSWRERLNVALGAAKGIDYLHKFSPPVVHGDISSTNILLSDLFEARIANSGLKNLEPDDSFLNGSGSVSSTQRLAYADPESLVIDQLTEKSDVYSFGVVLLEILCGRQPVSKFPPYDNHMQIVDWVKQSLNGGKVEEIVDTKMRKDYNEQALSKYTALSLKCVESEPSRRPNIDIVVRELEETIQLQ